MATKIPRIRRLAEKSYRQITQQHFKDFYGGKPRITINNALKELARRYNVPMPKWKIDTKECKKRKCAGFYAVVKRTITLRAGCLDLDTVLHEFIHYVQHYRSFWNYDNAFPGVCKGLAWIERPEEIQAQYHEQCLKRFTR